MLLIADFIWFVYVIQFIKKWIKIVCLYRSG